MHAVYRGSRLKTAKASGKVTASRTEPAVSCASKSNRAGRVRNYTSSESSEASSTEVRAWASDGALVPASLSNKLNGLNNLSAGKAAARVTFATSEMEASHPEGSPNFEFSPGHAVGPRTMPLEMPYERTRMICNQQAPPMTPGLQNTPLVAPAGQATGPRTHRKTSYERMICNQQATPMTPGLQNTPLVAPAGQATGPRTHRTTSYEWMICNQ
jgi:hypothetical protein